MKRLIGILTVAIAALMLLCQGADAGGRRHKVDPRVKAVGIGVGVASTVGFLALNDWHWQSHGANSSGISTAGAYAATSVVCAVAAPVIASAVVNRPLSKREVHVLVAGCFVPIVGPLLVNAAFDAHPEWEGRKPHRHRHRH